MGNSWRYWQLELVAVGLVAAHVRAHGAGRKQLHRVPVALETPAPVVGTAAGFQQHPQRRLLFQHPGERLAAESLAPNHPALRVGKGQLEHLFCQIDGDGTSMHGLDSSRDPVS